MPEVMRKKRVCGEGEVIPKAPVVAEKIAYFTLHDGDVVLGGPWIQLPNDHCPHCGSLGHTYHTMLRREHAVFQLPTVVVCCQICAWWEKALANYFFSRGKSSKAKIIREKLPLAEEAA